MIRKLKNAITSRFRRRSYALNQLDLKLLPYLDFQNGFFVEVGANDGISQSNTLYFEKHKGWKGLLIEAIPVLAEKCRQNRPRCIVECCALVACDYPEETVEMRYCNLMSLVKGAFGSDLEDDRYIESGTQFLREGDTSYVVTVPAKTLSTVLDSYEISHIDYLSLDVEGYEAEVLRGIDFERHAPTFLLVEVWHNKKDVIEATLEAYYREIAILNSNNTYSDLLYRLR